MSKYVFKHKLVQIPHPDTKALVTVSISNGQYLSDTRQYFRNPMKGLTRKQRQAARKQLKLKGYTLHV